MQQYIKKYMWLGGVLLIMLCAYLAASTVSHYLGGAYLGLSSEPARVDVSAIARSESPATQQRSKSGEPLAQRNMFCSDCEPPEPETVPVATPEITDPNQVPLTSLPLRLVATNVSSDSRYSFATIQNTTTDSQGAYWIRNSIPGAGEVVAIGGKYVDFRTSAGRLERIALIEGMGMERPAPRAEEPVATVSEPRGDDASAMYDEGIRKINENSYEIDRSLVDKVLANPMSVASGARIVPSVKNGKANGFKLYAIRPNSVYAKIGLRNGDTLHGINGFELTTPDKALEVYTKLKEASNLSVSLTRRGQPLNIDYTIR